LGREEWPTWKHGTWKHDGKKHRGWEYRLEAWDVVMRKENEGSMFEHACREATHGRFGLDVEVSKHLLRHLPTKWMISVSEESIR